MKKHVAMRACGHVTMCPRRTDRILGHRLHASSFTLSSLWHEACGVRHILLIFILSSISAIAQTPGTLRLFIEPGHDYRFVLDHKYQLQQREVTLGEGPHHFTIWAPKHRMIDTTLSVAPPTTTTFPLRLPLSAEYMAWQRELAKYKREVVLGRGLPLLAAVGFGTWTVFALRNYSAAYNQLKDDEELYASARSAREIDELKDVTLPADKDDFKKRRGQFYLAAGCTALSTAATVWMFHRTKGKKVPVFRDAEQLRFEGLTWQPEFDNTGGIWMASLSFQLP